MTAGTGEQPNWASLELALEWLSQLIGFDAAAVNLVRGDLLEVVVVTGVRHGLTSRGTIDDRDAMVGTTWRVEELRELLARAEDWGRFKFVAHGRATGSGWMPLEPAGSRPVVAGPDAWHDDDSLLAPLHDAEGTLVGCLSVDRPRDGRRPGLATRRLLDKYADHVALTIQGIVEQRRLTHRARILTELRELMRLFAEPPEPADLVRAVRGPVLDAFGADALLVHIIGERGGHFADDGGLSNRSPVGQHMADLAASAWARQDTLVLSIDDMRRIAKAGSSQHTAAAWLREHDVGCALVTPIGVGQECLGSLSIVRSTARPGWSAADRVAAREFGQDMGQVVHAGRMLRKEQAIVAAQRELDHAKSTLIAALAGGLRAPVDAIAVAAAGLDAAAPDRASLDLIRQEARRVARTTDDLLLLARLSDPDAGGPSGSVDLTALARRAVTVVEAASGRADITLRAHVRGAHVLVPGSTPELERMLVRLVAHAVAAADPDTTVTVQPLPGYARGELVIDGGAPLSDLRPLHSRLLEAPSIGLAIADQAVRRHSGVILIAESAAGTSFWVTLPTGS